MNNLSVTYLWKLFFLVLNIVLSASHLMLMFVTLVKAVIMTNYTSFITGNVMCDKYKINLPLVFTVLYNI